MNQTVLTCGLLAITLTMPGLVWAADNNADPVQPGIEFELGIGGQIRPAYEGSSSHILSPVPLFKLNRLTFNNGRQIGGAEKMGFSLGPAFNIVGERDSSEYDDIKGMRDIDATLELGLKLRYRAEGFRAYGEVRHGFGGHDGIVGEAGIDFITNPDPSLELYAGPRIFYADDEYMRTYFGVSTAEAARTGFDTHSPDGGIKSYGAEAGARLEVTDNWALTGRVNYERLIGDAADSPIVEAGSQDQFSARFGVVRKFRFNF